MVVLGPANIITLSAFAEFVHFNCIEEEVESIFTIEVLDTPVGCVQSPGLPAAVRIVIFATPE